MSSASLYLLLPIWSAPEDRAKGVDRLADFLAYGARTLLAPGNLPAFKGRGRLLLYTTRADWNRFQRHPVGKALATFVDVRPTFFDLNPTVSKHITMSHGHRILFEVAAAAAARAVPVFADSVFADGDLPRLEKLAPGAPVRMVMVVGFRMGHEAFAAQAPPGVEPLVYTPREVVRMALANRHSQMACWNARRPGYGTDVMGGPIWDVDADGLITHSIYWEPALVDFSHPWEHDSSPIEQWTIDGHYPWVNVGTDPSLYRAVADSDQFFHVTLARETGPAAYHFDHQPMRGTLIQEMIRARAHRTTDPLRQVLYETRVRVHSRDIDAQTWAPVEREASEAVEASKIPPRERFSLGHYEKPVYLSDEQNYRVVSYEGLFYAFPGPMDVDLENPEQRGHPVVLEDADEEALRARVREMKPAYVPANPAVGVRDKKTDQVVFSSNLPPVLLGSIGSTNIIRYNGHVYTANQALGALDFDRPEDRGRPGVKRYDSESAARAALGQRV